MLRVEGLGKHYGAKWILRGITFELNRGQALVVLGRNGAGKSTLVRLITRLLAPSEGAIALPEGDPRLCIGFSALDLSTYSHLTTGEHLEFAGAVRGCKDRTEELLKQVGLLDQRNQLAAELSSGMRARLKLAIAIQAEPELLVLDEPGAPLDGQGRAILDDICAKQRERGMLVVATNDRSERRLGQLELELGANGS